MLFLQEQWMMSYDGYEQKKDSELQCVLSTKLQELV